jgi:hypothetical protein
MLGRLALLVGYAKAPAATFVMRHPRTGATALALGMGLRESRTVRRVAAGLVGIGALGVALPTLAIWALRR